MNLDFLRRMLNSRITQEQRSRLESIAEKEGLRVYGNSHSSRNYGTAHRMLIFTQTCITSGQLTG